MENSFFIDNIEIPNINHFPSWGSTGGPIGLLNVDFIQDVNFYSGGFSSVYGDRLSSVMDIQFRDGNRDEHDIQFDLNMGGVGMISEGPLFNGKGSWMFSARKSYLDLLVDAIGAGVVPKYSDLQGKIVLDISHKNKLTILGLAGFDKYESDKEDSLEAGDPGYGYFHSREYTVGMNWFSLWSKNGYSNTSISHSYVKFGEEWFRTNSDQLSYTNDSYEKIFALRNINFYSFNTSSRIQFGFQLKHLITNQIYFYNEYTDIMGNEIPPFTKDEKISASKLGTFFNYIWTPGTRININLGLRVDYFSFNKNLNISPRFSVAYEISPKTSIYAAAGIFNQNLPLLFLYQNEKNKDLKDPLACHYILGINHLFAKNTRLTVEVYDKEYFHFPMSLEQPLLFQCDEFLYARSASGNHEFVDSGRARSYGIEITVQKKLATKIYGLISGAYFRTKYRDLNNKWRNRVFDNQYIVSVEGGYKPNNKWEFSLKWVFAGGIPYTPFDIEQSTAFNTEIYDQNRINEERHPAYHSLNVRFDKRFYFRGSNLTLFFSIWNVYNKKNIFMNYWNSIENKPDRINQWSILPVLGLEFEL